MDDLEILLKLAKSGDKRSQYKLAKSYEKLQNNNEALKWYKIVAERKTDGKLDESFYAKCKFIKICSCIICGPPIEEMAEEMAEEINESLRLCIAALEELDIIQNYSNINFYRRIKRIIIHYISFIIYCIDGSCYNHTIHYYKRLALLGVNRAAELLGKIYFENNDEEEALKWFKQGECYFGLGWAYKHGKVIRNYTESFKNYKQFVEESIKENSEDTFGWIASSMFELGEFYYNGWGVPQNFEEAAKWYRLVRVRDYSIDNIFYHAKIKNKKWAEVMSARCFLCEKKYYNEMYKVAISYLRNGEAERALEHFLLIYDELNDKSLQSRMTYSIARIYDTYLNDKLSAIFYYKKSVLLGATQAIRKLKNIYSSIESDEEKALEWFKQKNSSEFYYILGTLYKKGEGFKQNYSKALEAFKLAVRVKDGYDELIFFLDCRHAAMFELGELYYNGYGVPKNFEEAAKWYQATCSLYVVPHSHSRPLIDDYLKDVEKELPFPKEDESFVPF
jgi:suppressor of lin-12-like protein